MSDDPYSVDYVDELSEQDKQTSQRGGWFIYLSPGKEEKRRETTLRPAYNPDPEQNHGQPLPIMRYVVHEGLESEIPGTTKKLFPGILAGEKTAVCLNERDGDDYCLVCPVVGPHAAKKKEINNEAESEDSSKLKKLARSYGMFVSRIKATAFYIFVAFNRVGDFEDDEEAKKAGKIALDKKGKPTDDDDEIKWWTDRLGIVRVKAWWWGNFRAKISEKKFNKKRFEKEMNKGKPASDEQYKDECPNLRPSPFHPETGWEMEVEVKGKGLKQEWAVRPDQSEELSKLDVQVIKVAYPDIMRYVLPYGLDQVISEKEWMAKNKGSTPEGYRNYRLSFLRDKQREILFANSNGSSTGQEVDKSDFGGDGDDDAGEGGEGGEDVGTYSLDDSGSEPDFGEGDPDGMAFSD